MSNPKYRVLTSDELALLEKEFVDFLVINGITADDWVKIKEQDQETSASMVTAFSDVIMEGALRKTFYLEKIDKHRIASIHFQSEQMVLSAMEAPLGSIADFTDQGFIKKATAEAPSYLKTYTTSENYPKSREESIYYFTTLGWLVSDGKLYKALALASTK